LQNLAETSGKQGVRPQDGAGFGEGVAPALPLVQKLQTCEYFLDKDLFICILRRTSRDSGRSGMLVITRRNNEELVIGGDIRVRVVAIRGQRVQLGIDAPLDVSVRRSDPPEEARWIETGLSEPVEAR
jgi:carbon storage regulator